jgi:hypothetical protein
MVLDQNALFGYYKSVLNYGYAHHTADNVEFSAGNPDELDRPLVSKSQPWKMSQFADGGIVGTKPMQVRHLLK